MIALETSVGEAQFEIQHVCWTRLVLTFAIHSIGDNNKRMMTIHHRSTVILFRKPVAELTCVCFATTYK